MKPELKEHMERLVLYYNDMQKSSDWPELDANAGTVIDIGNDYINEDTNDDIAVILDIFKMISEAHLMLSHSYDSLIQIYHTGEEIDLHSVLNGRGK